MRTVTVANKHFCCLVEARVDSLVRAQPSIGSPVRLEDGGPVQAAPEGCGAARQAAGFRSAPAEETGSRYKEVLQHRHSASSLPAPALKVDDPRVGVSPLNVVATRRPVETAGVRVGG
jgi:hypothetical protein